MMSKPTRI